MTISPSWRVQSGLGSGMSKCHARATEAGFAGARVKSRDPLALFEHDAAMKAEQQTTWQAEDDIADMIRPMVRPGSHRPSRGRTYCAMVIVAAAAAEFYE